MDSIRAYLKDVRPIALLSAEDEVGLARAIQAGDKDAREKMICSNLRLVISIAKRYINLGIPLSDLIEEGNIGLMRSVEKFDPDKGYRFSTYAAWWIKQGISRSIIDQGKMIRVPVYMNEELVKYRRAVEVLTHKLGRKPQVGEIAKRMQLPVDKIKELEMAISRMSSLDAPIGEDGDGQVKDMIEDETLIAPDEQLEEFLNKERAREIVKELPEREREIITMRFGLDNGDCRTLAEIADVMGVSRERVRQLEVTIIKRLRQIADKQECSKRSGKPEKLAL